MRENKKEVGQSWLVWTKITDTVCLIKAELRASGIISRKVTVTDLFFNHTGSYTLTVNKGMFIIEHELVYAVTFATLQ